MQGDNCVLPKAAHLWKRMFDDEQVRRREYSQKWAISKTVDH